MEKSQIVSVYGKDDARAFINSKARLIHALNDIEDAELFARALGKKTVKVKSHSVNSGAGDYAGSTSSNTSFQDRLLMSHDEILKLPKNQEIILLESHNPIKAKKLPWYKVKKYRNLLQSYLQEPKT